MEKIEILSRKMAYRQSGAGDPIVFLHGNPTSSHLWRQIIPYAEPHGRCIAPDLIGMGASDKRPPEDGPGRYRFVEHRRYIDGLLEALDVRENVTFVIHDWGSALGFDWARRNPDAVKAIIHMEAFVLPWRTETMAEGTRAFFGALRSADGERLVFEENFFVERVLGNPALTELTEEDREIYRRPYLQPGEDRLPTLTWPREVPIDGEPTDTYDIMMAYGAFMAETGIPKLFINADPGGIVFGERREFCRSWPNQTEVTVPGNHFIQEQSPHEIGRAISDWLAREA